MAFKGLIDFIATLEKNKELHRISPFVNPELEITEVADRTFKAGGKALLFENTGTPFPLLINAFGSDRRMAMALSAKDLSSAGDEIERLLGLLSGARNHQHKLRLLASLITLRRFMPERTTGKGICQQIVHVDPDLGILPVLKCWPHDAGRFITLPLVHTIHPQTGSPNIGMYRMQIIDSKTTAIHWQRHKTGASHFEAWKKAGMKMPVSVALGGDPVYTYCSTAPLPEGISEYILAGFLRKKSVTLSKCITNDLFVPSDADIIIEGFVDPSEDPVNEGPFGDHTGFYSLSDLYPAFHVTCISHSRSAIYPATIVGIPPMEDSLFAKATEKIFLSPVRLAIQPEVADIHMPQAGAAHNLVIVKINKAYPGQGMKVITSLSGAGQMMFTKYMVLVSGDVDIRNYRDLAATVFKNTAFGSDILFFKGPLDVLDHSSGSFTFGGKAGIDATVKLAEELTGRRLPPDQVPLPAAALVDEWLNVPFIARYGIISPGNDCPILIVAVSRHENENYALKIRELLQQGDYGNIFRLIIAVDNSVDINDNFIIVWQVLANSDPVRDHTMISVNSILIDGTAKPAGREGYPGRWPNIVCSDAKTIEAVSRNWEKMGFEEFVPSPSLRHTPMLGKGGAELTW
ncbi:MAG: menaquinone biosynthesis decarboxylase [Bacteroidales bacterium]